MRLASLSIDTPLQKRREDACALQSSAKQMKADAAFKIAVLVEMH
jgi:hypothetical protein